MITRLYSNKSSANRPTANSKIHRMETISLRLFWYRTLPSNQSTKLMAFGSAETFSVPINNRFCFLLSETVRFLTSHFLSSRIILTSPFFLAAHFVRSLISRIFGCKVWEPMVTVSPIQLISRFWCI